MFNEFNRTPESWGPLAFSYTDKAFRDEIVRLGSAKALSDKNKKAKRLKASKIETISITRTSLQKEVYSPEINSYSNSDVLKHVDFEFSENKEVNSLFDYLTNLGYKPSISYRYNKF
jgi:hypothetical protein